MKDDPVVTFLKQQEREIQKEIMRGTYNPDTYEWLQELEAKINAIAEGPGVCQKNGNLITVNFAKPSNPKSNGNTTK